MIVCPRCGLEYDQGDKVCGACGSVLVLREEPPLWSEEGSTKKRPLRICPKCRLLYEKEENCISCGTPLVSREAFQKQETPHPPPPRTSERTGKEFTCPSCRPLHHMGTACRVSSQGFAPQKVFQSKDAARTLQDLRPKGLGFRKAPFGKPKAFYPSRGAGEFFVPKSVVILMIVLLLGVAGYFPLKKAFSVKPTSLHPSPSEPSSVSLPALTEEEEIEKINELLESIRQAHLREDIDLFMSCYSVDFENRQVKKESILEGWKDADYVDLSYKVKGKTLIGTTARIQVEWHMKILEKIAGRLEEGHVLIEALLEKENAGWKIKETKTVS